MEDLMDFDPEDIIDASPQDQTAYAVQQLAVQVDQVIDAFNMSVSRLNELIAQVNALSTIVVDKEITNDEELKTYMVKAREKIQKELMDAQANQANLEVFNVLLNDYLEVHDEEPEA